LLCLAIVEGSTDSKLTIYRRKFFRLFRCRSWTEPFATRSGYSKMVFKRTAGIGERTGWRGNSQAIDNTRMWPQANNNSGSVESVDSVGYVERLRAATWRCHVGEDRQ